MVLIIRGIRSVSDSCLIVLAVCEENPKSIRYHPGLWSGRRWSCCKSLSKIGLGCQLTADWGDYNNNPTSSEYRSSVGTSGRCNSVWEEGRTDR